MLICNAYVHTDQPVLRGTNLALKKPTNQTGMYGLSPASLAVDGLHYGNGGDRTNCAHPDNPDDQPAQWWVHLGWNLFKIYSVIVYNTEDVQGN